MIIVGAGISGLALMRALHSLDIEAKTYEKRQVAKDSGLAINLPGNAMSSLHLLGVRDAVADLGYPTKRREYRTETGKLLFSVNEADFWGYSNQPRCILRSDLMSILRQGLPDNLFCFGQEINDVQTGTDNIELSLSDGRTVFTNILIGADGVNSTIREKVFGHTTQAAILSPFSWRFMADNPGIDCWTLWAGPTSMLLLIPVSDERVYAWASLSRENTSSDAIKFSSDHFSGFPLMLRSIVDKALAEPSHVYYSPLNEVRMKNWSRGGTTLIGDAAHAMAPVWAQGAALGIEDALELSKLLAEGSNWPEMQQRFESLRRPRVEHVLKMTDKMSKAAKLPPLVRRLVLPYLGPRTYAKAYEPLLS